MNYRNKRNMARLSPYTVAKELGITEEKYKEVEQKKRPLEGNLVDKFQEVINNAKQIKLDRNIRMMEINRWFKSGEAKETLTKYGYNQVSLAKEIGLANTTVLDAFKRFKATDDVKEKIYDFLTNPMNKKIEEQIKVKEETEYKDLAERIKKIGITQKKFAELVGCSQVVVSYLFTGKRGISEDKLEKIERVIKQLEEQQVEESVEEIVEEPVEEVIEVVEEPVVVEEAPVVEETTKAEETDYKALYEELTLQYSLLLNDKLKYQRQVMLYEKLIEKM